MLILFLLKKFYAKWARKTVIYHNGAGKDYISSAGEDAKNISEKELDSFDKIEEEIKEAVSKYKIKDY